MSPRPTVYGAIPGIPENTRFYGLTRTFSSVSSLTWDDIDIDSPHVCRETVGMDSASKKAPLGLLPPSTVRGLLVFVFGLGRWARSRG